METVIGYFCNQVAWALRIPNEPSPYLLVPLKHSRGCSSYEGCGLSFKSRIMGGLGRGEWGGGIG